MKLSPALTLFALLVSCQRSPETSGIDRAMMDTTVSAGTDFFRHMNGFWLDSYEIPSDKSNYGMFSKLADEAEANLRTIIEETAKTSNRQKGTDAQKVGDLYASFMDSAAVEALGIEPIRNDLEQFGAVASKSDLAALSGKYYRQGVGGPFVVFVRPDDKKSTQYIVNMYQSGISLPDRDYYLGEDPKFKETRSKFQRHVEKMFTMAGFSDGERIAGKVVGLETRIAKAHWTRVENRNRDKTYNKVAFADLPKLAAGFDWEKFLPAVGFDGLDSIRIYQPTFVTAFGAEMVSTSLDDWKVYYQWRILTDAAPYLSSAFVEEHFDMFGRTIQGIRENRPRWKRGVEAVENVLGELVGRLYVERLFKPEAKDRMVGLVKNLREAFAERIEGLEWMSSETKKKALAKLEKFNSKIGYPDKWKDYTKLEVTAGDLMTSLRAAAEFEHQRQVDKLGKPIDRTEWGMTPQTVNAYYSPVMNEVVFPAAILQPPFFNMEADDAVNYGGIGAVIGHELTHGFDDQGRKSDGDGNLADWWTEQDGTEFEKRANVMVDQYNGYNPIGDMHVNGRLTLGENIADLGGLTIAYYAYKRSLGGKDAPVIDGMTGDWRFFLGWAQVWARKYRDDELRRRLVVDPHSPSEYRTNGIVSNMPEFYGAYGVKEGDPMFRAESVRVKIW